MRSLKLLKIMNNKQLVDTRHWEVDQDKVDFTGRVQVIKAEIFN